MAGSKRREIRACGVRGKRTQARDHLADTVARRLTMDDFCAASLRRTPDETSPGEVGRRGGYPARWGGDGGGDGDGDGGGDGGGDRGVLSNSEGLLG